MCLLVNLGVRFGLDKQFIEIVHKVIIFKVFVCVYTFLTEASSVIIILIKLPISPVVASLVSDVAVAST